MAQRDRQNHTRTSQLIDSMLGTLQGVRFGWGRIVDGCVQYIMMVKLVVSKDKLSKVSINRSQQVGNYITLVNPLHKVPIW